MLTQQEVSTLSFLSLFPFLPLGGKGVYKAIVDCNSFYCSCERLFRPHLSNRPVVVLSNNDGCIISRSDEAKALGVEMAVPYFMAKSLIEITIASTP